MNEKKVIESGIEYIVSTDKHGNKWWFHNEIKHRENGPAVEGATGDNEWWVNGKVVYIYDISIRLIIFFQGYFKFLLAIKLPMNKKDFF